MSDDTDPIPDVTCTITPEQMANRTDEVAALRAAFVGAEPREDGYTLRFDGADETVRTIADFVAHERKCCSFASYAFETSPPYEETRLTITGPAGTKTMFGEGLVGLLESS